MSDDFLFFIFIGLGNPKYVSFFGSNECVERKTYTLNFYLTYSSQIIKINFEHSIRSNSIQRTVDIISLLKMQKVNTNKQK